MTNLLSPTYVEVSHKEREPTRLFSPSRTLIAAPRTLINRTNATESDPKNMKAGAIVGIVVGSTAFVAIAGAVVALLLHRWGGDPEMGSGTGSGSGRGGEAAVEEKDLDAYAA
jgi:hypothetical protein